MPMLTGPNVIKNPFGRGSQVLVPAGTPLRSTHPRRKDVYYAKRDQHITVFSARDGHVDLWNDHKRGVGYLILPELTWPGSGGYWVDVKITPELCVLNGVPVPTIPELDTYGRSRLDVEPAFGLGYDNRDD